MPVSDAAGLMNIWPNQPALQNCEVCDGIERHAPRQAKACLACQVAGTLGQVKQRLLAFLLHFISRAGFGCGVLEPRRPAKFVAALNADIGIIGAYAVVMLPDAE